MIHKHKSNDRQNNMYVCMLHGKLYGIIGTYKGYDYDGFTNTLITLVKQFGYSIESPAVQNRLSYLQKASHSKLVKDGFENWVFKLLVKSDGVFTGSDSRYSIVHPHYDAYNCYIKEERYFGDVEDIRQLEVLPIQLTTYMSKYMSKIKYT